MLYVPDSGGANLPSLSSAPSLASLLHANLKQGWHPSGDILGAAWRVATSSGHAPLALAVAQNPAAPQWVLSEAIRLETGVGFGAVQTAALLNSSTPESAVIAWAQRETSGDALRDFARRAQSGPALAALAGRAVKELQRPVVRYGPIVEGAWVTATGELLTNAHLPEQSGIEILRTLDSATEALSYEQPFYRSALFTGARTWIFAHPDAARDAARGAKSPWLIVARAQVMGAQPADTAQAVNVAVALLEQGLLPDFVRAWLSPDGKLRALGQGHLDRMKAALKASGISPEGDRLLRLILANTQLAPTTKLAADATTEQALNYLAVLGSSYDRDVISAFISRTNVATDSALRVLRTAMNPAFNMPWARAARPWDRDFIVQLLSEMPGLWEDEPNDDILFDAVALGLQTDLALTVDQAIATRLGDRVADLPWLSLHALPAVKPVTDALEALLADPGALAIFTRLQPDTQLPLRDAVAAVSAAASI